MIKKSEVNMVLAVGALSAHSFQYFEHNNESLDNEHLLLMCRGMAEALILIDLGYSCTDDELNAGIMALSNRDDCPRDVKAAMFARELVKTTHHLEGHEKMEKMIEMAIVKKQELIKERDAE